MTAGPTKNAPATPPHTPPPGRPTRRCPTRARSRTRTRTRGTSKSSAAPRPQIASVPPPWVTRPAKEDGFLVLWRRRELLPVREDRDRSEEHTSELQSQSNLV